jgi:hypothetical protein
MAALVPGAVIDADQNTVQVRTNDFEEGYRLSTRMIHRRDWCLRARRWKLLSVRSQMRPGSSWRHSIGGSIGFLAAPRRRPRR